MGIHRKKTISGTYPQFGHAPSERFASPALGQQVLKEHQIISLPGAPTSWAKHMVTACRKCHDPQSKFLSDYTKRCILQMGDSSWTVVLKITRYIALSPLFAGYTT